MPASAAGIVSARSRSTSSAVARSCGALVAYAVTIAVSPAWLGIGGVAKATPSVAATACCTLSAAAMSPFVSIAIRSGPLKPGPKPSASQS